MMLAAKVFYEPFLGLEQGRQLQVRALVRKEFLESLVEAKSLIVLVFVQVYLRGVVLAEVRFKEVLLRVVERSTGLPADFTLNVDSGLYAVGQDGRDGVLERRVVEWLENIICLCSSHSRALLLLLELLGLQDAGLEELELFVGLECSLVHFTARSLRLLALE